MIPHWQDILGFAGGVIILSFRSWLAGKALDIAEAVVSRVEKWLVHTESEAVTWLHYRFRAQKDGHQHTTVGKCPDGRCAPYR